MKWLFCVIFSFGMVVTPFSVAHQNDQHDLTYFDHPFLLGDWYFVNPHPEQTPDGYRSIYVQLRSDYHFQIDVKKQDHSVQHWQGLFSASDDTLQFQFNSGEKHNYAYQSSHNTLYMNGLYFYKALPRELAGQWTSQNVKNIEKRNNHAIDRIDLLIKPDFVFSFRSVNHQGGETEHQGVFYIEQNHLVLMYENGQHDAKYSVNKDIMTLNMENGALLATLSREPQ
ncbi:MAG: hypothetical protein ACTMIA_04815 [Vibrio sp.]